MQIFFNVIAVLLILTGGLVVSAGVGALVWLASDSDGAASPLFFISLSRGR